MAAASLGAVFCGKGDYSQKGYGNSLTALVDVITEEYAEHLMLSLCETVGARPRSGSVKISVVSVHIYTATCRIFKKLWDGKTPIR